MHWSVTELPLKQSIQFEIPAGTSFTQLLRRAAGSELEDLVRAFEARQKWKLYVRMRAAARSIQAGEYEISPGDSPSDILNRLIRGDVVHYEVALLEGWTLDQVLLALQRSEKLRQTPELKNPEYLVKKYASKGPAAEGMFFPDTYHYIKDTRDEEILDRAHAKLMDALSREWSSRDAGLPYASPYEALVMASIIEKETGREADRSKIARVFVNRLEKNMRLQTDPTVIYGAGPEFDGNLTRAHLKERTPYNTYLNRGLPPTPIALAGLASLKAALHPADGDYLYFVARGDGSSEFSETLEQHQVAVTKYQLNGKGP